MDKSLELILDHLFEALALNFRPLKFRGVDPTSPGARCGADLLREVGRTLSLLLSEISEA